MKKETDDFNTWLDTYEPEPVKPLTEKDIRILLHLLDVQIDLFDYPHLLGAGNNKHLQELRELRIKVNLLKK